MKRIGAFCKKYWGTAVAILVIIVGYAIVTENELIDGVLFPTISKIADAFADHADEFPMNFAASMSLLIPSLIISITIALAVGVFLGMHKRLRDTFYPILYAISVVPSILLSPFALYLAPTFRAASIFMIVYSTTWPTLFATITGIMTIDKRYLDNAATLCLSGPKRLVKVILPAAMPSILSGFVTSLRSSFLVLVFAEMYSAQFGMGYFVKKNSDFGLYANTWAGFIFMVIVLVVIMQIFEVLKNKALSWTIDQ